LYGNSLYVKPWGSNTNHGTSFSDALKTISFAMSVIVEDSLRPITIFLSQGHFSPFFNGEKFPINFLSYVSLIGSGENITFLDYDDQHTVLHFLNSQDNTIDGLTIKNCSNGVYCDSSQINFSNVTISNNFGWGIESKNSNLSLINVTLSDNQSGGINCDIVNSNLINVTITDNNGSGINCNSSDIDLINVSILNNNRSDGGGAGINCNSSTINLANVNIANNYSGYESGGGLNCISSTLLLNNVNITNNFTTGDGGGINCDNSNLDLAAVNITNNDAQRGGGLNYTNNSILNFNNINRCNIYFNRAVIGNDIASDGLLDVVVDKFTVMNPTVFHTSPLENYTFDILQGQLSQVEADLFVSQKGDDTNGGLTEIDPLKTIYCAFSKILADSLHPHIINLLDGTYSDSTNGEFFPIGISDYVSLSGKSEGDVILKGGISIYGNKETVISDLTLKTGGIYCESSKASFNRLTIEGFTCEDASPSLKNVKIANSGSNGMYCWHNSNPTLEDVMIINNNRDGILISDNSNPVLKNVTVLGNRYEGITCTDNSQPILENVTVFDNRGGVQCWDSAKPSLINAKIVGNVTGIECRVNSKVTLVNATISDNNASGIWCLNNNVISLQNCIIWNNPNGPITGSDSVIVTYSNIEGGWAGEGNINEDPLFVGTGTFPYLLSSDSPCIDTGDPDTVYNDPEDPNNPGYALYPAMGTVRNDMGAYGGPNVASWNIVVDVEDEIEDFQTPTKFELSQNYPNPFNPSTTIQYSLKGRSPVELVLYDILGRQVVVLVNEEQDAGYYKIQFNAVTLASGIYFYRIQAGDFVQTKKMILLK
jgi:parallel beta-helix repeat protein